MKAKYAKPELSVVDFEENTAISACSTVEGAFNYGESESDCQQPGDIFYNLASSETCTQAPVTKECKITSITSNFDS